MKKELKIILEEIHKESDVNPILIISDLKKSGHLSSDEVFFINKAVTSTDMIVRLFDFIKEKDETVFLELQRIAYLKNLKDFFALIQSKLNEGGVTHLLHKPSTRDKVLNEKGGGVLNPYVKLYNVQFDVKRPSVLFTGREKELVDLHNFIQRSANKSEIDRKTVVHSEKWTIITGLGGNGKTQIVLRYIQQYGEKYNNNILWINSDTDSSISSSFQRLASEKLNLKLKTVEEKEKTISSIVSEVYEFFSNTKALFIFDNADGPFSEHFFPTGDNNPFILITSRMQQWGQIEVFKLNTFTEPDAIKFVKKGLKITDESQDDNIKILVKLFQNFPLALQQAVAFIMETKEELQCIGSEYNITNYLMEYEDKSRTKSFLDHKFYSDIGTHSSVTTYTTWKVTIDKIKQNKNHGQLSTKIFNLVSCFASKNINPRIFLLLTEVNEFKLGSAVKLLIKYSMVDQVDNLLNIHPLVQEITLSDLSADKNGMEECLIDAKNLLIKYFESRDNLSERRQFVLPHIESLLDKMKTWIQNNQNLKKSIKPEDIFSLSQYLILGYRYFDTRKTISLLEELLMQIEDHYGQDHYEVVITLYNLGCAYGMLGDPKIQKDLLERALVIQEEHYGPEHYQGAPILTVLGCAHGDLGDLKMKRDLLERALVIEEKHYGPDHFQIAVTLHNLGCAHGDLGDLKMKKDLLERALVIQEEHYGAEHYNVAMTLFDLGSAYGDLGDPKMQKDLLERALAIEEKHYGPDHYEVAKTLHNLGNAYGDLGDPKMKKDLLERALVIKEKHYGSEHYEVARTLYNLGNAHGDLGDPKMHKDLLERALAIEEKHYGPDHYQVAKTLHSLGNAYGDLGDPKMKKDLLERTLVIQEKHYGPERYSVARTLYNLGNAHGDLGDQRKKKDLLERALAIFEKHNGHQSYQVDLATTLNSLGNAHGELGDPKLKKELLERALTIFEKHYGPHSYKVATTLHDLGSAYGELGDPKMENNLLERALAIFEKHYGPQHIQVATILNSLGNARGDLGDQKMKKDLLEKALVIFEKHYGPQNDKVATTLYNLGNAHGKLGDQRMKKNLLERALAIFEKHYGQQHIQVATILHELGCAHGDLGDPKMKKHLLERALAIRKKHFGPYHYRVIQTSIELGCADGALMSNEMQHTHIERSIPLMLEFELD